MRKRITPLLILLSLFVATVSGCGKKENIVTVPETSSKIVVGFSQLGAESDWRNENTKSMKDTFTSRAGYELIFDDGQQKQSNQITAIRQFIQQDVDYIVLAPVQETGWDTVLQEALDARIPVILVDRMVDVKDNRLYTCWVGSDFELEAQKVTAWLHAYAQSTGIADEDIHIVDLQGNLGASAQIGRTKGLCDATELYHWDLKELCPADFTQAKGREVCAYLLDKYPDLNVVYCENDNMAMGAIEAIEEAGYTVGADILHGEIMVLSFDGVSETAMQYVRDGKITCLGECNPILGPKVSSIITTLESGQIPKKYDYVSETILSADTTVSSILVDDTIYYISTPY